MLRVGLDRKKSPVACHSALSGYEMRVGLELALGLGLGLGMRN
jgi:hypothetical protein